MKNIFQKEEHIERDPDSDQNSNFIEFILSTDDIRKTKLSDDSKNLEVNVFDSERIDVPKMKNEVIEENFEDDFFSKQRKKHHKVKESRKPY